MSRPADGWQDRAFCQWLTARPDLDVDTKVWFPGPGRNPWGRARKICGACLVQDHCLEYALRTETEHFRHGMWGGTTPDERTAIAAERRRTPALAGQPLGSRRDRPHHPDGWHQPGRDLPPEQQDGRRRPLRTNLEEET